MFYWLIAMAIYTTNFLVLKININQQHKKYNFHNDHVITKIMTTNVWSHTVLLTSLYIKFTGTYCTGVCMNYSCRNIQGIWSCHV